MTLVRVRARAIVCLLRVYVRGRWYSSWGCVGA